MFMSLLCLSSLLLERFNFFSFLKNSEGRNKLKAVVFNKFSKNFTLALDNNDCHFYSRTLEFFEKKKYTKYWRMVRKEWNLQNFWILR